MLGHKVFLSSSIWFHFDKQYLTKFSLFCLQKRNKKKIATIVMFLWCLRRKVPQGPSQKPGEHCKKYELSSPNSFWTFFRKSSLADHETKTSLAVRTGKKYVDSILCKVLKELHRSKEIWVSNFCWVALFEVTLFLAKMLVVLVEPSDSMGGQIRTSGAHLLRVQITPVTLFCTVRNGRFFRVVGDHMSNLISWILSDLHCISAHAFQHTFSSINRTQKEKKGTVFSEISFAFLKVTVCYSSVSFWITTDERHILFLFFSFHNRSYGIRILCVTRGALFSDFPAHRGEVFFLTIFFLIDSSLQNQSFLLDVYEHWR